MSGPSPDSAVQIHAVSRPTERVHPWRAQTGLPLTFAWRHGDDVAAGFGVAAEVVAEPGEALTWMHRMERPVLSASPDAPPPGPWFGGMAFDLSCAPTGVWAGFPAARFVVPELLVLRRGLQTTLHAFGAGPDGARQAGQRLQAAPSMLRVERTRQVREGRPVVPLFQRDDWFQHGELALAALRRGTVSKVVLARSLDVTLPKSLDVLACAESLERHGGQAAIFVIRGREGSFFLGATPEQLIRCEERQLETQALASSARPEESARLARGDKEQREHLAVVDGIREALQPLSSQLQIAQEPRLLELPYISHLKTPIRATLRAGVGIAEVLGAMYPTAAVGGVPREAALELIGETEGRAHRGWYAGAVGWVGAERADLHVAIRSGLVKGSQARVFVGAGLVAGSDLQREWEETQDKAQPFLRALGEAFDETPGTPDEAVGDASASKEARALP